MNENQQHFSLLFHYKYYLEYFANQYVMNLIIIILYEQSNSRKSCQFLPIRMKIVRRFNHDHSDDQLRGTKSASLQLLPSSKFRLKCLLKGCEFLYYKLTKVVLFIQFGKPSIFFQQVQIIFYFANLLMFRLIIRERPASNVPIISLCTSAPMINESDNPVIWRRATQGEQNARLLAAPPPTTCYRYIRHLVIGKCL